MAVDVIMPQMGESIFEGTITKWLKKPGDKIDRDEPLFEISTDKVDAEIPSPSAGVLKEIKVTEGQTVPIQTIVAVIDVDGKGAATATAPKAEAQSAAPAATPAAPPAAPAKPASSPTPAPAPAAKSAAPETVELPLSGPPAGAAGAGSKVRSSPLVRRMAREHQIDLSQVSGTGAGGRVSKHDMQAAIEGGNGGAASAAASGAPSAVPPPPPTGGAGSSHAGLLESAVPRERMYFGQYEVQPMSIMRQKIAEHMVLSKRTSPHVYSVEEVDVTAISALRGKMKEKFEEQSGTKLTFMPFFIRAVVEGLRAFPR